MRYTGKAVVIGLGIDRVASTGNPLGVPIRITLRSGDEQRRITNRELRLAFGSVSLWPDRQPSSGDGPFVVGDPGMLERLVVTGIDVTVPSPRVKSVGRKRLPGTTIVDVAGHTGTYIILKEEVEVATVSFGSIPSVHLETYCSEPVQMISECCSLPMTQRSA